MERCVAREGTGLTPRERLQSLACCATAAKGLTAPPAGASRTRWASPPPALRGPLAVPSLETR
jgi:hypothetical protein